MAFKKIFKLKQTASDVFKIQSILVIQSQKTIHHYPDRRNRSHHRQCQDNSSTLRLMLWQLFWHETVSQQRLFPIQIWVLWYYLALSGPHAGHFYGPVTCAVWRVQLKENIWWRRRCKDHTWNDFSFHEQIWCGWSGWSLSCRSFHMSDSQLDPRPLFSCAPCGCAASAASCWWTWVRRDYKLAPKIK